jgi:hypothetical protein
MSRPPRKHTVQLRAVGGKRKADLGFINSIVVQCIHPENLDRLARAPRIVSRLTTVEPASGYGRVEGASTMEETIDILVTTAIAVGVAGYLALLLEHIAHAGFGLSYAQIRDAAMFGAIVLTMPTAIGLLGQKRSGDAEG